MKASYQDFLRQNSNCSRFTFDPIAQHIFSLLSQDKSIIAMIEEADQGKPALGPCIQMVESYALALTNPSFDVKDDFARSVVGRMAGSILKPFGYRATKKKDLPKRYLGQYFSCGTCYALLAPEEATMQVVKKIEEV